MGKVVLGVLIAAILFAGFWFGYYQEGANQPITLEGEFTAQGRGLPFPFPAVRGKVELNLTTSKIRFYSKSSVGDESAFILCMDKRKFYLVDFRAKRYAEVDFELVPALETKRVEANMSLSDVFKVGNAAKIFGSDGERYFARQLYKNVSNPQFQMRVECWFTKDTRIGRGYVGLINQVLRIEPTNLGAMTGGAGAAVVEATRPQVRLRQIDYFPIPLKASFLIQVPSQGLFVEMTWNAKKVSRRAIASKVFEPPSGFSTVPLQRLMEQQMRKSGATTRQ